MDTVQTTGSSAAEAEPGMGFAREFAWVVSNGLIAEGVHALWWFGTAWPRSAARGEAIEGILIMAIIYVPFVFAVLYPLLRLALKFPYSRSPFFATLTGPWLSGVAAAVLLLLGGEHISRVFVRLFT